VTIQAEILDLLRALKDDFDLSLLLITHDLGVVAEAADRVAVMYAGRIVEDAPVREVFSEPRHPYTEGLLRSVPRLADQGVKRRRLDTIEGSVPNSLELPAGCTFAPRCAYEIDVCTGKDIPMVSVGDARKSRCVRHDVVGREASITHSERLGRSVSAN